MKTYTRICVLMLLVALSLNASAERIKDMASIQGVRENQLVGYGLVVGLDGSGDQTTQTPFTVQSEIAMLSQMGVNLPAGTSLQLKNVAAVMLTATLPPFSRRGQAVDVTASSIGNAKSLRGGTLLLSSLKGADGQVYAMAQGNLLVGGAGASANGSKTQVNHLNVGLIPGGATVEREVPTPVGYGEYIFLSLKSSDFTTSSRVAEAINRAIGSDSAAPLDGRTVQVRAPEGSARIAFLAQVENVQVDADQGAARVIINARTGSVVMNQNVTLDDCAVSHGNLTVVVNTENTVSQPNLLSKGETEKLSNSTVDIKSEPGNVVLLKKGVSLGEVVKALNSIGATPQDLLVILQAMKSAGALHAALEVI